MELAMHREGTHLVPVDNIAAEELMAYPRERGLLVTIKTPRNPRQFRLAWALASVIADAIDWLHDRDDAMDWLKIKCRHVKYITDPKTGEVAIIPKSIAFASLSQDAFNRLFNRMIFVTTSEIIPGLTEKSLRAELLEMVGGE